MTRYLCEQVKERPVDRECMLVPHRAWGFKSPLGHGYWCDFPKTTSTTWRAPGRAVPPLHRGRGGQVLRLAPPRAVVNAVQKVAATRGVSMAQVALAWVLRHPAVTAPIIGATKPQQPSEAVAALGLHLTDDEIHALQDPYTPHGPSWFYPPGSMTANS